MFRRRRPPAAPSLPPLAPAVVREASAGQLAAAFAGPPDEAARWIAAAARAGMVEAQILYGQILLEGRGVPADPAAAFAWFKTAATTGAVKAETMLGRCHELGWGTPIDLPKALAIYAAGAQRGYDWAQYNLASLLARDGQRAEAFRWFRASAEQGHAKSMTVLGRYLEEGWETPRDPAGAHALYARAAALGDFRAQFNMGTLAATPEAALDWFTQAAATGSPGFLGQMAEALSKRPEPALQALSRQIFEKLGA
ncbi:tetratricopeptide repeat protein [Roseomonas sp. 18066]|uniref:tetratricopeptide repeat protein n=1 Tax=Roseomonas sp. 18066 TaxID=2681412 RepID=UPI00135877D5|nr:tetratricopeptide repeat protein [Roseomonas sp. 18066]